MFLARPIQSQHSILVRVSSLTLSRIEYWDRAGGGRNIACESSTANEVRTEKLMRAAQKGLKMSCMHLFGHHN